MAISSSKLPLRLFHRVSTPTTTPTTRSTAAATTRVPEPEGVAIGELFGRTYAFIGLERIGGIMVYEITNPFSPRFVQYVNPRDFSGNAAAGTAGDLGPEGVLFIPASDEPITPTTARGYQRSERHYNDIPDIESQLRWSTSEAATRNGTTSETLVRDLLAIDSSWRRPSTSGYKADPSDASFRQSCWSL